MPRRKDTHGLVLAFLRSHSGGLPPTVREICAGTGIHSTSTVHKVLRSLEEQGLIEREANMSRSIKISGVNESLNVPLVGVVTAGIPILADENIEEYIPVSSEISGDGEMFALRVKGLSMMNAGILDGDIIFAEKTDTAADGDIVVALIGDEATVKRYFRDPEGVRLMPENPDFQPIISKDIQVLGRVKASFRKYS